MNRHSYMSLFKRPEAFKYTLIRCSHCDGIGMIQEPPSPTSRIGPPDPEICEFCEGTGMVETLDRPDVF